MKKLLNLINAFLNRFPFDSKTAGVRKPKAQHTCNCYREHDIELVYDPIDDQILRLEPDRLLTMRVGLDENNERMCITREYYDSLVYHNDLQGRILVESLIGKYETVEGK